MGLFIEVGASIDGIGYWMDSPRKHSRRLVMVLGVIVQTNYIMHYYSFLAIYLPTLQTHQVLYRGMLIYIKKPYN
jgi:hypothetical protein